MNRFQCLEVEMTPEMTPVISRTKRKLVESDEQNDIITSASRTPAKRTRRRRISFAEEVSVWTISPRGSETVKYSLSGLETQEAPITNNAIKNGVDTVIIKTLGRSVGGVTPQGNIRDVNVRCRDVAEITWPDDSYQRLHREGVKTTGRSKTTGVPAHGGKPLSKRFGRVLKAGSDCKCSQCYNRQLIKLSQQSQAKLQRMLDLVDSQLNYQDFDNQEFPFQIISVNEKEEEKIGCGYCFKTYISRTAIIKHLKSAHPDAWAGLMAGPDRSRYEDEANTSENMSIMSELTKTSAQCIEDIDGLLNSPIFKTEVGSRKHGAAQSKLVTKVASTRRTVPSEAQPIPIGAGPNTAKPSPVKVTPINDRTDEMKENKKLSSKIKYLERENNAMRQERERERDAARTDKANADMRAAAKSQLAASVCKGGKIPPKLRWCSLLGGSLWR